MILLIEDERVSRAWSGASPRRSCSTGCSRGSTGWRCCAGWKTYGLLRLAGTPFSVLDGARLRETLIPLALLGGGSVAAGIFCALPLAASAGLIPSPQPLLGLVALAPFAALGLALAELAGGLATRQTMAHRG